MSAYGTKVVAVLDTQSAFGITVKQIKDKVDTLDGAFNTLTNLAPETLDTLSEVAATISAIQDAATLLTNRVSVLEVAPDPVDPANFYYQSNLTTVDNPLRGSKVLVGNNVRVEPAAGYALEVKGGIEMDNNAKINVGGGLVMRTTVPASPVDGDIYFDKTALALKIYVDDGNSAQWIQL